MNQLLSQVLTPDAAAMVSLHSVTDAMRRVLPDVAIRRDEVISALSAAGYRFAFIARRLHVTGAKLAI